VTVLAAVATVGATFALADRVDAFLLFDAGLFVLLLGHLLYWRRRWRIPLLERLRNLAVFSVFAEATVADYAKMVALRLPMVVLFVAHNAVLLPCFEIDVPLSGVAACTPIVSFVTALPISIAGLGTYQVAVRELFGHALGQPLAVVDAFSTVALVGFTLTRLVIGVALYALVLRRIAAVTSDNTDDKEHALETTT
jgi:hypothetical protein